MLKRIIALSIMLCLSLTCFTGCGKADITYLNLIDEISNLEEFEFISESKIVLCDEVKDLVTQNVFEDIDFSKYGDFNLNMSGVVDVKSHYINLDVNLKDTNNLLNTNTELFITEGGIFISKESLFNLYYLYLDTNTVFSGETISVIIEKLSENFSTNDYICLDTINIFTLLEGSEELYKDLSIEDKAFFDFIKSLITLNYRNDLDLTLVKKDNKSYTLELGVEDIKHILNVFVSFLNDKIPEIEKTLLSDEHFKVLFGEDYLNDYQDEETAKIFDGSIYVPQYIIYKESIISLIDTLGDLCDYIIEIFNDEGLGSEYDIISESLKGSKYINTLRKNDNVYYSEETLILMNEGIKFIDVITKSTITVKNVETKIVSGGFIEDFIHLADKISYAVNPAEIIEGQWSLNSDKYIYMEVSRKEGTEELITNYLLKDGRLYLPLRKICETFGEIVSWDSINNKAYIIRGNEKIDMTGMVVDNLTYIKIRDFERLNYNIEYVEGQQYNTVIITKR